MGEHVGAALTCLVSSLCVAIAVGPASASRPDWMPPAPPLPVTGHVVSVANAEELARAVQSATDNDTIRVADGIYQLSRFLELAGKSNVTIRGASGDPTRVVIRGLGWDSGTDRDDILRIQGCHNTTVAFLTFAECRAYGVKLEQTPLGGRQLENITIYGCNFLNIGTRAIKGTGGGGGFVDGGSICYCTFENTRVPPRAWLFDGDYISAIDCMRLKDWTISDNFFRDIKGANGGGRGAIFVWVESQNVVSERNVFLGCDRSICYGNPSGSTEGPVRPHMTGGIIRNNFIVAGKDTGIEICWADDVKVYHNTVLMPDSGRGAGIHYHWQDLHGIDIRNNIVRGRVYGDEAGVMVADNITAGVEESWFQDAAAGDLHLTPAAGPALGAARRLADSPDDFDRAARNATTDAGADQME